MDSDFQKTGLVLTVRKQAPVTSTTERAYDCSLAFHGEPAGDARIHITDIAAFDALKVGQSYELRGPVV